MNWKNCSVVAVIALAVACSDHATDPVAGPDASSSVLIPPPNTLKFKVSGNWRILVDVGDYVKKVAGDSLEYVVHGAGPVRVPGSAVSTDATGGTTYGILQGLYNLCIDWTSFEGCYPVWQTGSYFKLVSQTGNIWTFEITTGSQYSHFAWTTDNTGDARFADCNTTPLCP